MTITCMLGLGLGLLDQVFLESSPLRDARLGDHGLGRAAVVGHLLMRGNAWDRCMGILQVCMMLLQWV